jgi:hypothetical protein
MYASTYFELCSLVPSEEEIKRQLHQLIEVAGANVKVRSGMTRCCIQSIAADDAHRMTWCCIQTPCPP